MFKFLQRFTLITMFFLCFSQGTSFAAPAPVLGKQEIKIGYYTGAVNNLYAHPASKQGYFHVFKEIENISNYEFNFEYYTKEHGLEALEKGQIDLFGPVHVTDEIKRKFVSMQEPAERPHISLVFDSNNNVFYDAPEDINGKTIATYYDNSYNHLLDEYLRKNNITAQYIYGNASDYHTLKADFYLVSNRNRNFSGFLSAYNFTVDKLFFIAKRIDTSLIKALDVYFDRAITVNGQLLEKLYLRHLKSPTTRRYLTKSEMQKLRATIFSVGYTTDHRPIQFTNSEHKPDGISIDIMNLLAQKYGFKVDYHGYDSEEPGQRRDYDILLSSQDVFDNVDDLYIGTDTYLELPLILFTSKDGVHKLNDKKNPLKIGIYNYIGFDKQKIYDIYPNATVINFNKLSDAVAAYFTGKLDAGLFTTTGAEYVTSLVGKENFSMIGTDLVLPLRFYISKKLPYEYVEIFNLLLDHVDHSQFNIIVTEQSVAFTPDYSWYKLFMEYKNIIVLFLLSFTSCVILYFFNSAHKKREAILKAINFDELTGLSSMYYFNKQVQSQLDTAAENEFEIISLDVDHFNLISKLYGYNVSRDIIIGMANGLKNAYKNSRASVLCRINAECFVIFYKAGTAEKIETICNKYILPEIRKVLGERFFLSFSVGVCTITSPGESIFMHMDRANIARLKGKSLHKHTYHYFDDSMQRLYEKQTRIVSRMEQAIRDKEFYLQYQPKVDLKTLKVHGAEALVRWLPSDGTNIYPDEFIPIFESNGFIETLDLYVFESVCQLLTKHIDKMYFPVISVNLSTYTLKNPHTPIHLKILLQKYQISPKHIELEITESALIDDASLLLDQVESLKQLGFTVSLDDFGSGVSTLNRLASINVDTVKLDKLFLHFNINDKKGSIVVENVIRLSKELNMQVVCEGVEIVEQAIWLKQMHCDLVQGYYFDKPLPEDVFLRIIAEDKTYSLAVNEEPKHESSLDAINVDPPSNKSQ